MIEHDYHFTLYGHGPYADAEKCDEIAESLGGSPDVSIGGREGTGITEFSFDRSGASAASALRSALKDIEAWGYSVVGTSPGPLCTVIDIAVELDRTHASVAQLIRGDRGPGGFPAPYAGHNNRARVFRWVDVIHWLEASGIHTFTPEERRMAIALQQLGVERLGRGQDHWRTADAG